MNHLIWEDVSARQFSAGCAYGLWEGTKCFQIHWKSMTKSYTGPQYEIVCALPGFRKDLPLQNSVEEAKQFCEKMLTRWVAKRGLIFKAHLVVTDAMRKAARNAANENSEDHTLSDEALDAIINAAIAARG